MKKLIVTMISIAFLLVSAMAYTQSEQPISSAPPVSQPLVPEGDFALKLVTALKLGTPTSEAQAEDILTSVGIVPKNGWIADYPMTPIIIGELQNAVAAAAEAHKLPMGKDEALKTFQDVVTEFSLAVGPGSQGPYAEAQPQSYTNPTIINNYYYEEGPPIITYYPPPWDYYYLYAWVPYPFWWSRFYFPGFFILHDFHKVIFIGHRKVLVTNHFFDHRTKKIFRIDHERKFRGDVFRSERGSFRRGGFKSGEARRGAESIFERSRERSNPGRAGEGFRGRFEQRRSTGRSNNAQTFDSRRDGSVRQPVNIERRNEIDFQRPSGGERRFFNAPSRGGERSFSPPPTVNRGFGRSDGFGRSFNSPNRSFSAPKSEGRSFSGGPRGGGGEFRGGGGRMSGGFSGGHGGCKGRC